MLKNNILNTFLLGIIGFVSWYYLRSFKKETDSKYVRLLSLEKNNTKLDLYQKLYVALMREYTDKKIDEYHSYITEKFKKKHIESVILYGCGPIGKLFFDIINDEPIKVTAFVDKTPREKDYHGIPVYEYDHLNDVEKADCIIVTPVYLYDLITDELYASGRDEEILPLTSFVNII